jgi:hypothetical protein
MRQSLLSLMLVVFLAGCGGGQLVISDQGIDSQGADSEVEGTVTALAITPFPTLAPTAPFLEDSADPLTLVLGGMYDNGGYWSWDDIVNLLGVYAQSGVYVTSTAEGVAYTGVPLPYLLRYARLSANVQGTTVFTREGVRETYQTSDLRECMTCLIVRASDDTLTLVLPPLLPPVMEHVVRIESW